MRTEWVVLADSQRARIFARAGGGGWQDVRNVSRVGERRDSEGRELRLPAAMQKLHDALSVTPGGDFLDRLARELRVARKRGDFDTLILVAPADILEPLKAALDSATRRAVAVTAAENLVNLPVQEARRALAQRF